MQGVISSEQKLGSKIWIAVVAVLLCIILWLAAQISQSRDKTVTGSTIVHQIQDVSELTTSVLTVERIIPVVSDQGGALWTKGKLLYVASGSIRVGIDLSDLKDEQVQISDHAVTVILPALRVLGSSIDVKHSYVYSYDEDFLGLAPTDKSLQQKAENAALSKIEAAACTDWMIATATGRAEKIVKQILEQVLQPKGYQVSIRMQQDTLSNCSKT